MSDHRWTRDYGTTAEGLAQRLAAAAAVCRVHTRRHAPLADVEATLQGLLAAMRHGEHSDSDQCAKALAEVRGLLRNASDGDAREFREVESVLGDIVGQRAALSDAAP